MGFGRFGRFAEPGEHQCRGHCYDESDDDDPAEAVAGAVPQPDHPDERWRDRFTDNHRGNGCGHRPALQCGREQEKPSGPAPEERVEGRVGVERSFGGINHVEHAHGDLHDTEAASGTQAQGKSAFALAQSACEGTHKQE